MSRKHLLILTCFLLLVGTMVCVSFQCGAKYDGSTTESREKRLADTPDGMHWNIVTERLFENYILSGTHSNNGKNGIAVFRSIGNGHYKLVSHEWKDQDRVIVSQLFVNGNWYDLIWFGGVNTSRAEITYSTPEQKDTTVVYETQNMDIIMNLAPFKEYTINIAYFDNEGNMLL